MGLKLDIGSGNQTLPGYVSWDIKHGQDGGRLEYPDGSVEALHASHVLEHFSHLKTADVLKEWFRVLEPGGVCQIAVPDFNWVAGQMRGAWKPHLEWMITGGHIDESDYHKAIFDEGKLRRMMEAAGFEDIQRWTPSQPDCSALMCSLNLQGMKPRPAITWEPNKETAPSLAEKVKAEAFWYHKIELPGGIITPGFAPLDAAKYKVPDRLDGLTVLDIGTWDGYWAFEAVKRGAKRVLAIDNFSDDVGIGVQHPQFRHFDMCREALGISASVCDREQINALDIDKLGMFDVVFCFGVLYHVRHPLLFLEKIGEITRKAAYFESAICDYYSPYRGGIGMGYAANQHVMEFYPANEYGKNYGNWWCPTLQCLCEMLSTCNFHNISAWPLTPNPEAVAYSRGFVHAHKVPQEGNAQ